MESLDTKPSFGVADFSNGFLWLTDSQHPVIYCVDPVSGNGDVIGNLPYDIISNRQHLFSCIVPVGRELWLIPWTAREIYIYNIRLQAFESVQIPSTLLAFVDQQQAPMVCETYQWKGHLYLRPSSCQVLFDIEIATREITCLQQKDDGKLPLAHALGQMKKSLPCPVCFLPVMKIDSDGSFVAIQVDKAMPQRHCQSICRSEAHTFFVDEKEIFVDDFDHPLTVRFPKEKWKLLCMQEARRRGWQPPVQSQEEFLLMARNPFSHREYEGGIFMWKPTFEASVFHQG